LVADHIESGAEVTVAAIRAPRSVAGAAVIEVDDTGRRITSVGRHAIWHTFSRRFLAVVATLRLFAYIEEHIQALRRGVPIKCFPGAAVELRGCCE